MKEVEVTPLPRLYSLTQFLHFPSEMHLNFLRSPLPHTLHLARKLAHQQPSICSRRNIPVVILTRGAILCDFRQMQFCFFFSALPQTALNVQSASTKEKERLEFDKFPNPSTFAVWKMKLCSEVCSGSCHPSYPMTWLSEIDSAKSVEDVRTFGSIVGK